MANDKGNQDQHGPTYGENSNVLWMRVQSSEETDGGNQKFPQRQFLEFTFSQTNCQQPKRDEPTNGANGDHPDGMLKGKSRIANHSEYEQDQGCGNETHNQRLL